MTNTSTRPYPWLEYVILVVATFLAIEAKRQFGLFAHQVFGPPGAPGGSAFVLSLEEWLQICLVALACLVHWQTRLPAAPWLERKLYGWHEGEKIYVWRPARVAVLLVLAYVAVYAIVVAHLGFTSKLGAQLHSPNLPKPVLVKLAALYPVAAIGAAISEENVYRFAVLSLLVWLIRLAVPRLREQRALGLWLPIVIGGIYFGYVHVAENIETVRTGSMVIDVLTTPQTFAGIVFGYVYCRFGLEAAMVTHGASDLTAPVLLKLLQALHG